MTEEKSETKNETKSDTITIKKDALWKYSTFVLAGILVILVIFFVLPSSGNSPTTGAVVGNQPAPTVPTQPSQVTATADDDARIGSPNAPVEIIEFSDFECPFCARVAPTLKQIIAEYGDDVTLVYRDFPLTSIHPMAIPAAVAAECVRQQGGDEAFFQYHDKIFANQQLLNQASLGQWAQELGYNLDCDNSELEKEVLKDLADATAAGGRGTPYFVINGIPLSGAQPFSAFKTIIDAELAK